MCNANRLLTIQICPLLILPETVYYQKHFMSKIITTEDLPKRRGFTLIELMITIAIVAILLSLAAWSFSGIRDRIRRTSCRENMRVILQAAHLCQTEMSAIDNKNITVEKLKELGYLRKRPLCPSGGKYWIQNEKEEIRVTCVEANNGANHGFVE